MPTRKRYYLWRKKGLRSVSQLTLSVIPMFLSFWVCRKTGLCWKTIWKKRWSCRLKNFVGTGPRLYVCRNPAARYAEQYPLLCGHGVLQQNPPRLCVDRTENEKADAGDCRSAQYVLKLLCGGGKRPGR